MISHHNKINKLHNKKNKDYLDLLINHDRNVLTC